MVEVGTRSLHTEVHQEKNRNQKKTRYQKNSTVSDKEFDSLSLTVEFFFWLRFLFLVNFCMQTPAIEFNQGYSTRENKQNGTRLAERGDSRVFGTVIPVIKILFRRPPPSKFKKSPYKQVLYGDSS